MSKRDLEEELWSVYNAIGDDALDQVDRRLKALELLVKIRAAGQKVKPDATTDADAAAITAKVLRKING
jgi:hypothetical protein